MHVGLLEYHQSGVAVVLGVIHPFDNYLCSYSCKDQYWESTGDIAAWCCAGNSAAWTSSTTQPTALISCTLICSESTWQLHCPDLSWCPGLKNGVSMSSHFGMLVATEVSTMMPDSKDLFHIHAALKSCFI